MSIQPRQQRVLCAGRLYCDLVFTGLDHMPKLGSESFATGLGQHAGGGAYITAATLCALGQPTSLLATIPAPPFDRIVHADLENHGVEHGACHPAAGQPDPQITIAMADSGDRAFLTRRVGRALPELTPDMFSGARHLHIGELHTLREHPDLIDMARTADMTISLDCGWDDHLMSNGSGLDTLIASVDVFFPNSTEAQRLLELGVAPDSAKITVTKRAEAGANYTGPEGDIAAPTTRAEVIDATGAGDAFNGGFLFEWLNGSPIATCLATANLCGFATVQATGGTGGLVHAQALVTGSAIQARG